MTFRADGGLVAEGVRRVDPRGQERLRVAKRPRDEVEAARERAQADPLIERDEACQEREASGVRDRAEADAEREAALPRHGGPLADDLARAFHETTEGNARGTHRLAGAADEAGVEVLDERWVGHAARRDERAHERDAAARGIRLVADDAKGRTVVEAEAARDARGELVGTDRLMRDGHDLHRTISA